MAKAFSKLRIKFLAWQAIELEVSNITANRNIMLVIIKILCPHEDNITNLTSCLRLCSRYISKNFCRKTNSLSLTECLAGSNWMLTLLCV